MNIIYIPVARGLVYLAVVLEVQPPRAVVARLDHDGNRILRRDAERRSRSRWQVRHLQHRPGLTGAAFTGVLASHGMAISMDGRGAWRDDVFVERLWHRVKTRKSIYAPMTPYPMPAPRSADTSTSTMVGVPTRALTASRRIKLTSTRCRSARQPSSGRSSTYRREIAVQTTGAISQAWPKSKTYVRLTDRKLLTLGGSPFPILR